MHARGTKEAKINSKKGKEWEAWQCALYLLTYLFIFVIGLLATLSALIGCTV